MGVERVAIRVCVTTSLATYAFGCPQCQELVEKPASELIVESLAGVGAEVIRWNIPAEMTEPKVGPPINHDDLLEFHLALETGNWHEELLGLTFNG